MRNFTYSEMESGQEGLVSKLVWEVFDEFVAPGYSQEGIEAFRQFIQADEIKKSVDSRRFFIICCWDKETLAGVISMRGSNHISLLFVKKPYQRCGIAKKLYSRALKRCREMKPYITEISVNSSPYAVNIYKRIGFSVAGEQTTRDGITFVPMEMALATDISFLEMQIDDYSEIYELWCDTPGMGLSDADTYESIGKFLLRNKGLSLVCRNRDKVIATILCGHDGRRGYIYHVTVAQEYRGRGIGRMLVEKSLQKLKEDGIDKCHLFVFQDNEIGKAFWSATGWIGREDIFVYSRNI